MWETLPNNADWDFQDSDFAGDLEDSKSTFGGTLCVFWKSYICSNKLDVQKNKLLFLTVQQNLRLSLWTRDWGWMVSPHLISGRRFTYFQILRYALERWVRNHFQILSGRTSWCGSKVHHNAELWTHLMMSQWNIFPGFTTLQLCYKVPEFLSKMSKQPEEFTGRIIFMSMFNDISWGSNANLISICPRRFPPGRWSFLGPGSEKKWYSTHESKPQGEWARVAELMMIKFSESGHPVFRSTSPLSWGTLESKGGGQLSIHFCADEGTIETVFRAIISVNQLSIYGEVSDLCEECKISHVRTGRPVLVGQSDPLFVPSVMKTHTLPTDDPAQEEDLLQRYQERVER